MNVDESIKEAYIELVIERNKANISVVDICEKAGVSRKAFYYHFLDRFDLEKKILLDEIQKPLYLSLEANFSYEDMLRLIFTNFKLRQKFYSIVVIEETQNSLFDSMIDAIMELIKIYPKPNLSDREKEYINYRYTISLVYTIRKWIIDGMIDSPDTMVKVIMYKR